MFKKIMIPVDLAHADRLDRALSVASDLAAQYDAELCYVGVTTNLPGKLGHSAAEYEARLAEFAKGRDETGRHPISTHVVLSHDPTSDLDAKLRDAVKELGADLVVMATHVPNFTDRYWPSHGGALASHTDCSIFLVRGG